MNISVRLEGGLGDCLLGHRFSVAIKEKYPTSSILEISTKSKEILGQRLSAFNLELVDGIVSCTVESAYQGSKIFELGGPFTEIYNFSSVEAKQDPRLLTSGKLVGFEYNSHRFAVRDNPNFYDYLYIKALVNSKNLVELNSFDVFTDFAFSTNFSSPKGSSRNCQARSFAIFIGLSRVGMSGEQILNLLYELATTEQFSEKYNQLDFEF